MKTLTRWAVVALSLTAACTVSDPRGAGSGSQPAASSSAFSQASPAQGAEAPADEPPLLPTARELRPSEWIIGPKGSTFLVFRGAASPNHIRRVIAGLEGAPATFFIPGRYLKRHPGITAEILEAGSFLGNHGWTDKPFIRSSSKAIRRSIRKAEVAIARAGIDPRPFLFAPRGQRGKRILTIAGRHGYRSVKPTESAGDGGAREVARGLTSDVRPGSILGLNLARRSHRRAAERIVRRLVRTGLAPAPLARLQRVRPVHWDVTLAAGSEGPRVEAVQRSLNAATYPAGEPDGVYGAATIQAVLAFEKVNGLERDGVVDPEQMERILLAEVPDAPPGSGSHYLDIDLTRQVLFEVQDGKVINTYPVSSANGETYASRGGRMAVASTPRGSFEVERKIPGWRVSYLGQLYYPVYFYGGYAIHGSSSVPAYPASHGCIRIPMHVAADFYSRNGLGVPITVHD